MKKTKILKILSVILFMVPGFYNLSLAGNCTTHNNDEESGTADIQAIYEIPCEISGITLMAETDEICITLKEKISSHDHD